MLEAKNTARALVRIGYDGRVFKIFRGDKALERFTNEVRVLRYLEKRGCPFVPRLLDSNSETLEIVTSNAGARVAQIGDEKMKSLFEELESFGVRHDDPYLRNITYRASDGRFCIIDFEFAEILADPADVERLLSADSVGATVPALEPKPTRLCWSGMTDIGRVRPNNEDVFLAIAFDMFDFSYLGKVGEADVGDFDFVFAVSDGMGGEKAGEFASRCTIDNITRLLPRRFGIAPTHYAAGIKECLIDLFRAIHSQLTVLGQSYSGGHNMGATLSLIWRVGGTFYFGHIGDTRIYVLPKDGGIQQITEDHTHVGWLRRKGEVNEREARCHPRKNVLAQALGSGNQYVNPQVGELSVESGDRIVLCSDGVIEGLWDRGIDELIREPSGPFKDAAAAERLVRAAVLESGRDNATAVVVEVQ